jgi:hypothetical protein
MSARIAVKGQNSTATPRMPRRRPAPATGDVLVSRPTARADIYEISVVATRAYNVAWRYQDAMQKARELAKGLRVDGWFTCDHTHFVRIVKHRMLD